MFARKVAVLLKPNSLADFTRVMENEVLVWLRKQQGFQDLITLAVPGSTEVATISFWDHRESALAYDANNYPKVLKILEQLLDGAPYVKTFDVVTSTFQKLAFARRIEAENLLHESGETHLNYRPYETSL